MVRNWKMCLLVAVMALLLLLTACGHEHTWAAATCTEPETCTDCGETQGAPLGHTWAEETTEDYIQAVSVKTRTCEECGEAEEEIIPMETLHDNSRFLCTAEEFALRLEGILLKGKDSFGHITVESYMAIWWLMKDNGDNVGGLFIIDGDETTYSQFGEVVAILYGDEAQCEFLSTSILSALMPSLDDPEALYDRLVAADGEPVEEDGLICYLLPQDTGISLTVMTELEAKKYDK